MSMSAGAGSPIWFKCPKTKRALGGRVSPDETLYHRIDLTGRTKPYRARMHSALGVRSTHTSREYECRCGHVGWSNHVDLERLVALTKDNGE